MTQDEFLRRCRGIDGIVQVGVGYARELEWLLPGTGNHPLIGFEPAPSFAKHWEVHEYPGEYIPKAVSDAPGSVRLYTSRGRREASSMFARPKGEPPPVTVESVTLDGYFAERGGLRFTRALLWVDCEGAELLVLRGAAVTLQRCAVLMVSCHESHELSRPPGFGREGVPARSEVKAELRAAGFHRAGAVHHQGEVFVR